MMPPGFQYQQQAQVIVQQPQMVVQQQPTMIVTSNGISTQAVPPGATKKVALLNTHSGLYLMAEHGTLTAHHDLHSADHWFAYGGGGPVADKSHKGHFYLSMTLEEEDQSPFSFSTFFFFFELIDFVLSV